MKKKRWPKARGRNRSSLPSSKQRAAPTSPPPAPRHLPHLQSLPVDERGGGSPHVIVAEPHPLTQQLRLHASSPPSTRRPGAEKLRASTEGNVVVETRSNQRRLQEGHDVENATVARPRWTGFSPVEGSAGEHDALSRGCGTHRRRRRQGFRPKGSPAQTSDQDPDPSLLSPPSSLPRHPNETLLERHRCVGCT